MQHSPSYGFGAAPSADRHHYGYYGNSPFNRDCVISRELFHWETPNSTRTDSKVGRRFLDQPANGLRVLLAVRQARADAWGATSAYRPLGPAHLVEHAGDRPIAVT